MDSILVKQINLQQLSSTSYRVSSSEEWAFNKMLLGGTVAAQLHRVAEAHFTSHPDIAVRAQPDVLNMHIEFISPCAPTDSIINVTNLRVGAVACTIQMNLVQKDRLCVTAFATSTNFERPMGPSASTDWKLSPEPAPIPDFERVLASKPEKNWIPFTIQGEVYPMTERMFSLSPRDGFRVDGVLDAWCGYRSDTGKMRGTEVALMTDTLPSLSDTLLRNGGLYDSHANHIKTLKGAEEHPGQPTVIRNTMADAMKLKIFNVTTSLDMEFKRRVPKEGLRFIFQRTATKMMHKGRMGLDITICDQDMQLLCTAQQLVFILPITRRLRAGKSAKDGKVKPNSRL